MHYLSDIVSRSAGNDLPSLMPVRPPVLFPDPGFGINHIDESHPQDDGRLDRLVHRENLPVQSVHPQNVRLSDQSDRRGKPVAEKTFERAYFTRFTERVENVREINPGQEQHDQPVKSLVEEPAEKISHVWMIFNNNVKGKRAIPEGPNIIPDKNPPEEKVIGISGIMPMQETHDDILAGQKKQNIHPSPEPERKKLSEIKPVNSSVEHIMLGQPVIREKVPVQKEIQQETPKLVIGKIIVEIIPPVTPPPARTITRIVPSAQDSGFSKSSKLSFGLGQL